MANRTERRHITEPIFGLWVPDGGRDETGSWLIDITAPSDMDHPAVTYERSLAEKWAREEQADGCDVEVVELVASAACTRDPARPGWMDTVISGTPCCECGHECIEFSRPSAEWNATMRPDGHETDREYLCAQCYMNHLAGRAERAEAKLAEATRKPIDDAAMEALTHLAFAEHEYRHAHDLHGDGSVEAGMAWDKLRQCGDAARAALQAVKR